jgi:cell division protein FtsI/penicillin-binding protein 2
MSASPTSRIRLLSLFIFLAALLLIGRLFQVQILKGSYYLNAGEKQYSQTSGSSFSRGFIYFSRKDGQHPGAAILEVGYTLAIKPKEITNPEGLYKALATVLPDLPRDTFLARAKKSNDPYEEITKKISKEDKDKIDALKLTGLVWQEDRWRAYPGGELAAQVLGFVGYKGDEFTGRYGLEKQWNDVLNRSDTGLYQNFFVHIFSDWQDLSRESSEGDLVLTIEPTVQSYFEEELKKTKATWGAKRVGGIIMDPKTGAIVSMAGFPTFNPGEYGKETDLSVFTNPTVESDFEMGSIMKPLTMAFGIDAGVITPKTTYNDAGHVKIADRTISNFDGKGRGVVPMQEVLNKSLNTGAVFVEQQLGQTAFRSYLRQVGFDEKTGIDLPNEVSNLMGNLDRGGAVEYATAAFGQGIAVSPIAMARSLSVLANGGKLITPHVVNYIERRGLPKEVPKLPEPRQVLKPETTATVTNMLVNVVDVALQNGKAKLERYQVAAKTGTAQLTKPGGGYYSDRYFHSFFGFFPASDPKFLVFLYLEDPNVPRYSAETLTAPFLATTKFLLNYYQVPPDR